MEEEEEDVEVLAAVSMGLSSTASVQCPRR
jgi:hypothetical protein